MLVDEDIAELPSELAARDVRFVRGNPARDETLGRANIDRASHAIVLAKRPGDPHSDALNLMITIAIEARTRAVRTTVECVESSGEELLRKAGCDSVVCLARFDGHFIGNEVLQPGMQVVVDDLLSTVTSQQLCLSPMPPDAKTFQDVVDFCVNAGHVPLGVLRGQRSIINPAATLTIEAGDRVISIGPQRLG